MARVHRVKSSRKERTCSKCGKPIVPPEGYTWAAPGFRARPRYRHLGCGWRASELTTSLVSQVYAAQEALADALPEVTDFDGLESAWSEFTQALNDYRDERESALEQWEHGNSQLEEYRDTAEAAASEAEGYTPEDYTGEFDADGEPEDPEAYDEWLEEQRDAMIELAEGLEV